MRVMRQIRPIPTKERVEVALWISVCFSGVFVPGFLVLVVTGPRDTRTEIISYNGMHIREEKSKSEAN
jgi:hypothetical protein